MGGEKKKKTDKEIILDICESLLQLVENEIEMKPFGDGALFDFQTDNDIREMFKKHISKDIEKEIRNSRYYVDLKVVLMSEDNKDKIKRTVKTFTEMLEMKGVAINANQEILDYLETLTIKHMKRK